ncbi:MAG: amidohydrolase family protein, partial [Myxococcota bacterium]
EPLVRAARTVANRDPRRYATYLASRPPEAEEQAIALLVELCRATRTPVHIVHHSAASALQAVAAARAEDLPLSAETCPHYLHFAAEDIPDGATEFKCAPPIREAANRELLWQALGQGVLDMIVSDHSPCTVELKGRESGDFLDAWGGVASLQLTLPVTWTGAAQRGFGVHEMARWMCLEPARLAGLSGRKGAIAPGCDADLVVWDPEAELSVNVAALDHKNKISPYHGLTLRGRVFKTFLRGQLIYDEGVHCDVPSGQLLSRQSI